MPWSTKDTIRQADYDKAHCRRLQLKLNLKTDADILEQLDKQRSMQGYIRDLIRADIAAKNVDAPEDTTPSGGREEP